MPDGTGPYARLAAVAAGGWALTSLLWAADALRRRSAMHTLHRRTVELLLNALSAENAETERHSRRVADLSYALAQAAGLRGRTLRTLRVAALLHDMGKIDDRFFDIVHSRERLTREQQAEIRHHPHQSAYILEPLEGEHRGLRAIVCGHHERWDGGGYPDGLQGEEIPLGARIIAVADAFDAMTQSRPYRGAMDTARALEELRSDAGAQFDPRLVDLAASPRVRTAWEAVVRRPLLRSGERNGPRGRGR
jgi:HD-GYP domain-containing protein (c-di-GMP phosphodiesterase class II)